MLYILLLLFIIVGIVVRKIFLIISGYGAKNICSNIFICNRTAEDVIANELSTFPLNLGRYNINLHEQSVTGTVMGFATKKAVYKKGLGAILLNHTNDVKSLPQGNFDPTVSLREQSLPWPKGDQVNIQPQADVDVKQLQLALDDAFLNNDSKRGTRAVIVVRKGEIIAEQYAGGFSATSKFAGWSLAKSITSALVGILVKQGKLSIATPAPVTEWTDERRHITIEHLLTMTSGLRWWEFYKAPSDATNMLYNEKNMGLFALSKKLKYTPGTRFRYSSGSTNIISFIIRQTLAKADYYNFPYKELFHKIGMRDTILEVDAGGTFAGSSYCFSTARDWARFGLLYLNEGLWNGQQILPGGWVNFTRTPTQAQFENKDESYGAHWWLNTVTATGQQKYPAVPADCFMCKGYEGQYIFVIPSHDLVIVRLALEKGNELDPNTFVPAVLRAVSSS